jgi:type II secretory pathway pseudopilin PulG
MLKLNNRKGFILIEAMAGIVIFAILFLASMTFQTSYVRLKLHNEKMSSYRFYLEIIRNRLLYDSSYEELLELRRTGQIYINKSLINSEALRERNIEDIFSPNIECEELYIKAVFEGEEVLAIELQFKTQIFRKVEIITCQFYRGFY